MAESAALLVDEVLPREPMRQWVLNHLGSASLSRSNLSRINESKPYSLHEALFGKLYTRCQAIFKVRSTGAWRIDSEAAAGS
jgi:hypothetical protein